MIVYLSIWSILFREIESSVLTAEVTSSMKYNSSELYCVC